MNKIFKISHCLQLFVVCVFALLPKVGSATNRYRLNLSDEAIELLKKQCLLEPAINDNIVAIYYCFSEHGKAYGKYLFNKYATLLGIKNIDRHKATVPFYPEIKTDKKRLETAIEDSITMCFGSPLDCSKLHTPPALAKLLESRLAYYFIVLQKEYILLDDFSIWLLLEPLKRLLNELIPIDDEDYRNNCFIEVAM